jgi:hypothetical protein
MAKLRTLFRLALAMLAIACATAGCLDLDGYHLEGDAGADAADADAATD